MAISSINFKTIKANSQAHNERQVQLDYNFPDLEGNNQTWKSAEIAEKQKQIEAYCKKVSGRKLQKNAEPIREAVVNLNAHHTLEDLQELGRVLKKKHGIECFQIHIHRDEGKNREELNHHGHMLFSWQDKATGKTIKLNKADLSQIQTLVATTLKMERGQLKVNSNRERLEPIEFKRQQEELRLQKLQSQIQELEQKKNTASGTNKAARERHGEIESEYRNLVAEENANRGHFKAETERLAIEGAQEPQNALKFDENELRGAIKLQCEQIEKLEREIQQLEYSISECENYIGRHPDGRDVAIYQRETRQLENEIEFIEVRQGKKP